MAALEHDILSRAISRLESRHSIPQGLSIRQASTDDADQICAAGQSAGQRFGTIPALADLVEDEDLTPTGIQDWLNLGGICLVEDETKIVGFAAAHTMDDALYIAEISVALDCQGKGVGSLLIEMVFEWARERERSGKGNARVSLTTYADTVPWNGPWYAKRGFKEVEGSSIGPKHDYKMTKDVVARSLDRPGYRRCAMLWEDDNVSSEAR